MPFHHGETMHSRRWSPSAVRGRHSNAVGGVATRGLELEPEFQRIIQFIGLRELLGGTRTSSRFVHASRFGSRIRGSASSRVW